MKSFKFNAISAIKKDLLIGKLLDKEIFDKIPEITDDEALAVFQSDMSYLLGQTATVSHIMICHDGLESCASKNTKEEAKKVPP